MAVLVRNMRVGDVPAVVAIEQASFTLPWTQQMIRDELDQPLGWSVVVLEEVLSEAAAPREEEVPREGGATGRGLPARPSLP